MAKKTETIKHWNYYEVLSKKGHEIGIVQCPECKCTIHWQNYNEYLKGIRYCPFCGQRLEDVVDIAEQEAGAKVRPWKSNETEDNLLSDIIL